VVAIPVHRTHINNSRTRSNNALLLSDWSVHFILVHFISDTLYTPFVYARWRRWPYYVYGPCVRPSVRSSALLSYGREAKRSQLSAGLGRRYYFGRHKGQRIP